MADVRKVGMLTGGGDAPGLNGVIRAVTTRCNEEYGYEVVGIKRGWKGLLEPESDSFVPLDSDNVRYILEEGGTILGSSRTNPYKNEGDAEKVVESMKAQGIDALQLHPVHRAGIGNHGWIPEGTVGQGDGDLHDPVAEDPLCRPVRNPQRDFHTAHAATETVGSRVIHFQDKSVVCVEEIKGVAGTK